MRASFGQVCFMVGFAPGSIQTVFSEKGLKPQDMAARTRLLQSEARRGEYDMLQGSPSRYACDEGHVRCAPRVPH